MWSSFRYFLFDLDIVNFYVFTSQLAETEMWWSLKHSECISWCPVMNPSVCLWRYVGDPSSPQNLMASLWNKVTETENFAGKSFPFRVSCLSLPEACCAINRHTVLWLIRLHQYCMSIVLLLLQQEEMVDTALSNLLGCQAFIFQLSQTDTGAVIDRGWSEVATASPWNYLCRHNPKAAFWRSFSWPSLIVRILLALTSRTSSDLFKSTAVKVESTLVTDGITNKITVESNLYS